MTLHTKLKKLREVCEKATSGKWLNGYPNAGQVTSMPDHVWTEHKELIAKELEPNDALFIAQARTMLPRLIEALEKAIEQRDELIRLNQYDNPDNFEIATVYPNKQITEILDPERV